MQRRNLTVWSSLPLPRRRETLRRSEKPDPGAPHDQPPRQRRPPRRRTSCHSSMCRATEGMALDLDWVARVQANTSAIERRGVHLLPGRRTVKKGVSGGVAGARDSTLIDLTTLAGDDTVGRVRRLCAKARQPVRADLLAALRPAADHHRGLSASITTWWRPRWRRWMARAFPVAAVSTGFPAGLSPFSLARPRRSRRA